MDGFDLDRLPAIIVPALKAGIVGITETWRELCDRYRRVPTVGAPPSGPASSVEVGAPETNGKVEDIDGMPGPGRWHDRRWCGGCGGLLDFDTVDGVCDYCAAEWPPPPGKRWCGCGLLEPLHGPCECGDEVA